MEEHLKKKKNDGKRLVLIGFMGSGKTTVGLKLSYLLHVPVEDTDKWIVRREGCSISEIFAREGEAAFREKETELLRELAEKPFRRILSAGGGTPLRPENQELLRKCGTVVYLRAKPETIFERLKGDVTRPLLQCEDPLAKIQELLEMRRERYEACADIIIDVDEMNEEDVAQEIVRCIRRREEREGGKQ